MVASGCRQFDDAFAATTAGRLGPVVCARLEELLSRPNVLAELKSDPGPLGLDTLLAEIGKLSTVRAIGLDGAVFGGASDRIVAAWRARAARMYPSDFEDCGDPVRYALLAALCWTRQAELVDGLVELLIGLIHRINARAERRVEKELIGELANVPGKRGIFTRMVDAALEHPDDTVREALYPVVPGGVKTLSALARELKATERAVAERVRYQLRGSYSHYYRARRLGKSRSSTSSARSSADRAAVSYSIRHRVRSRRPMSSRVSSCSTSARDRARERSGRGLRRSSIRDGSAASQPCRCQYAAADRTAFSETFHVDGARCAHRAANPPGEPFRVDLAGPGLGAELGHDPAEDPAVGAACAGLLGAAQGGEVGVGGRAEGDVTGGRGEAADRSHGPDAIRGNGRARDVRYRA